MVLASSSQRIVASLLGAIGVVLWATETTLITYTTAIPPLQTVALAFMFAFLMSPLAWKITGADPMAAFRHPVYVWAIMVGSLVGYHACIYYATQKAPPAAAALLHGATPLMIVFGSALLPGERLKWFHVAGVVVGLCGVILLIDHGADHSPDSINATFYLSLVGIAAALWGLYSVVSRSLSDVPSSAMGAFYGASAIIAAIGHLCFEGWVQPQWSEWVAIAALGILPMGLAIYLWDYGMKRGDIQALGAFSYVEPFIGAILVAAFTSATLEWNLVWSGSLVVTGAILASKSLWPTRKKALAMTHESIRATTVEHELSLAGNQIIEGLLLIRSQSGDFIHKQVEIMSLIDRLATVVTLWDELILERTKHEFPIESKHSTKISHLDSHEEISTGSRQLKDVAA